MDEINEEFYKLKSSVEEKEPKSSCSSISQIFTKKQYLQPFASLNILFFLMLFSGKFAIEMYAVDIFQQTQVTIDEHLATVILGMVWYGMVYYGMVWYSMVWYGRYCKS